MGSGFIVDVQYLPRALKPPYLLSIHATSTNLSTHGTRRRSKLFCVANACRTLYLGLWGGFRFSVPHRMVNNAFSIAFHCPFHMLQIMYSACPGNNICCALHDGNRVSKCMASCSIALQLLGIACLYMPKGPIIGCLCPDQCFPKGASYRLIVLPKPHS